MTVVDTDTRSDRDRDAAGTISVGRFRVGRRSLLFGALFLNTELWFVLLYALLVEGNSLAPLRYTAYGLLWITVGVWAVAATRTPTADRSARRTAAAVALGYFAILAVAGGIVVPSSPFEPSGFRIAWLPPGWGPALIYGGSVANLVLMPARVVGYLALAYLVYATALDAMGSAAAGVLGLLSCVSCTWPVLASLATGVFGGGTALASAAMGLSYGVSTAVFLLTVGLLSWRPFAERGE